MNKITKPLNKNGRKIDRGLAHELNLELMKLIMYRQQRKFILSAGLLLVKILVVGGLILMTIYKLDMGEGVENLLLILITAVATTQAKLTDFWFNNQSDDSQLVREATSYAMDADNGDDSNG